MNEELSGVVDVPIEEAQQRMEELAVAKSIVQQHEAWLKDYVKEHGEIDHAGLWCGLRQSFKEVDNPQMVLLALLDSIEQDGMPLAEAFVEPRGAFTALQKVSKNLRGNKDWRDVYMKNLDFHGGEEGATIFEFGSVQSSPVKSRPSGEKSVILEPGEEARK